MKIRPVGDRVLVRRVHERQGVIAHVHEVMGVTDRVMQLGEVVGIGPAYKTTFADRDLRVGDLVVYPTPRVHDHFTHQEPGSEAWEVLVLPGYWICGIVTDTYLAEHHLEREYAKPLPTSNVEAVLK